MSRNSVVAVIVVLLLIVGGWYLMRPKPAAAPSAATPTPSSSEPASPSAASEGAMMKEDKNLVTISSTGFTPQNVTVKTGDTVTWMNGDTADHTVNSAPHPTHTVYPPLNLGVIKPGDKKSLSFPKAGTYKYHDHLNPSLTGTVTVQ